MKKRDKQETSDALISLGCTEAGAVARGSMSVVSVPENYCMLINAVNGALKHQGRAGHRAAFHQCPVITLIYNGSQGPSVPEGSLSGPVLAFSTTYITVWRTLNRSEPW